MGNPLPKPFYIHGWPGSHAELDLAERAADFAPWSRHAAEAAGDKRDILAFSLGAFTALQWAAERPETVGHLTLVSPAGPLELGDFLPDMAGAPVFRLARRSPAAFSVLTHLQSVAAKAAPKAVLSSMFKTAGPDERALLDDALSRAVLVAGLQSSLGPKRADYVETVKRYVEPWAETLSSVQAPVTIIHGDADVWTPPAIVEALADALPRAPTMYCLPGRGHYGALKAYLSGELTPSRPSPR